MTTPPHSWTPAPGAPEADASPTPGADGSPAHGDPWASPAAGAHPWGAPPDQPAPAYAAASAPHADPYAVPHAAAQAHGSPASYGPPYGQAQPYGSPVPYGSAQPYGSPVPYGQAQPYGQPYGPPAPWAGNPGWQSVQTEGMAIGALVTGLVGLIIFQLVAPVGAVLGAIALRRIERHGTQGTGMAWAGIVTGILGTLLLVLLGALVVGGFLEGFEQGLDESYS